MRQPWINKVFFFLLLLLKSVYFLPAALATLKPEFIDNFRATKKKRSFFHISFTYYCTRFKNY